LPEEYENEVPRPTPSASQNVFGVSAESMQCSYDLQGNMVPTILLLLQKRLYDQGGLKVFYLLPSLAVSFLFCVAVLCF
jgi:hypothetical protein